ncbi:thermonuclease family protein [Mycolicibacterium wolinskyi]|uniref:thermonuclease family protein n=1 Tax=Mycolicibacterium TaxID=1866885 RepID=UPI000A1645AE|nr:MULTISPECIES: thermonuclease family protein [Mycolicibacterium]MCV7289128.1 thermonuclease family protein [Mycolicibacterium wolinskyi]MCV7297291.1 thermonuclease family protein [Mycolicibacterium goodii]
MERSICVEVKRTDRQVEPAPSCGADPQSAVNRTLAYLDLPDGRDFSVESVRAGMSQVVTYGKRPVQRFADLTAAENEAKTLRAGLWGPPCFGATESVPE